MPDEIAQTPVPKVEASPTQMDLRAELQADLKSAFKANLSTSDTLPKVACESLVALLSANAPSSADVIAALGLEDPTQPEVPNE